MAVDGFWATVVGLVGGVVIGVLLTILVWHLTKQRRQLGWTVDDPVPFVEVSRLIAGRVQVLVDGKPVERLLGIPIKVENVGNQALENLEVMVQVTPQAEILEILAVPPNPAFGPLRVVDVACRDTKLVQFRLLNPKDKVSIWVLTVGEGTTTCQLLAHSPNLELAGC